MFLDINANKLVYLQLITTNDTAKQQKQAVREAATICQRLLSFWP